MVPAAQGSLSRHAVQEDRRCHAVLPNLGDRGDRQDPVGRQRQGIRPGGVVAQHRTSMEGGAPQKTYRGAVLAGFTFLARGAGRALETGVTSTARGTGITTSTLGTIFASRAGGTGGGLGYPVGGEDGVSANGGSFSSFITRILAPPGALGRLLHLKTLRKKTFLWADELPGITQQLFSSGTLHRLVTGMEQAASPKPLNPGVRNPGSSQAIPAAPKRTQLPQNSH